MKEEYIKAVPKSSIGKELGYSIERWARLSLYTENGMLSIDNNPVENSIRPVRWFISQKREGFISIWFVSNRYQ